MSVLSYLLLKFNQNALTRIQHNLELLNSFIT
ncbi:uncharacterized protein LOC119632030 [Glossina fuscipes]|uniref:Uncharacterized protein LOC119632030 n=1 Tax=Glossina fuscipes TaxID=7396 RepID=A0A8U0W690_9MUSC|nr:uncharacterized protein LOC119632030 [Glossina fuscipes]